ncbi:hypothetical protein Aconfl_08110 [Algoriphagus confluentis]|uniref:Uncharacterized protein n=1 Tax=Algoriphagus confluentis TaxID=1697556 RepID=A0ABQ6PJP0_9BACT|nr:hypothetical protein Aconfl_08110 [Algoriphagus confluentis]
MISPIRDWDGVIGFGLVKGKADKELAEGIVGHTFVVRTGWRSTETRVK